MKKLQQRAYKRRWAATTRHLKKQCRQSTLELESDDSEQENDTTILSSPETVTSLQYMDAAGTTSCTAAGADNATYSGLDSDENDADWRLIDHHVTLSSDSENESDSECFEDHLRLLATEYHVKHNALDSLLKLLKKVFQMAPSFVVVEFLGERSVAVVPTIWTEDHGKNSFCYWPRPNPTHSRIRKAEIPDKEVWDRLPIRVFRKTFTEEVSTKRSHITPECSRNDEEDVFDADDKEEIRPKKKCKKEKPQILVQAPPLPELPPFNFPISSEYQTTSASTSQYQTTPRHPGRPHSPARSSTSRLSPDRNNASSSSKYQTAPASTSQYQTTPASTSQYQTAPRSSRNALDSELFQLNMKVQNILENQGEMMRMLRGLAAQSVGPESVDVQDLIDQPFETLEQLKAFCERLDTDLLLRKQLVKALTALGGQNLADTVRTMLRKIATNKVLEQLGLRGKSGKVAFEDLPLYRIINKACRGVNKQTTTAEVDCELGEVLKLATFRKGGSKFEEKRKN
ncbi:uncharacterized protein LOC133641475 isoform X3 [Entelurus aequoreus]|uniref:uncharacterized protein LOC133641475 isoform X3 n=1 Tax=Entelurus aequoreus TaxID=161455 RepID=UPI002B1DF173|nr:uncharacterized protein LOC133641475 isoform X3 [Entelurus aequoreus]